MLYEVITVFGREVQFVETPVRGTVSLLGVDYSEYRLLLVGAALILGVGVALVLHGTRLGLVARAVIANEELAAGLVLGMAVERLVVRPLYGRPLDAILATWGLAITIGQVITLVFGREVQFVETSYNFV